MSSISTRIHHPIVDHFNATHWQSSILSFFSIFTTIQFTTKGWHWLFWIYSTVFKHDVNITTVWAFESPSQVSKSERVSTLNTLGSSRENEDSTITHEFPQLHYSSHKRVWLLGWVCAHSCFCLHVCRPGERHWNAFQQKSSKRKQIDGQPNLLPRQEERSRFAHSRSITTIIET